MKKHLAAFTFLLGSFDLGAMQYFVPEICDRFHAGVPSEFEEEGLRLDAESERLLQKQSDLGKRAACLFTETNKIFESKGILFDGSRLYVSSGCDFEGFLGACPDCPVVMDDVRRRERSILAPLIEMADRELADDEKWQAFKSRISSGLFSPIGKYYLPNSDQTICFVEIISGHQDLCDKSEKILDELRLYREEIIKIIDEYFNEECEDEDEDDAAQNPASTQEEDNVWDAFKWSFAVNGADLLSTHRLLLEHIINPIYAEVLQNSPLLEVLQKHGKEFDQYLREGLKYRFDQKNHSDMEDKLCREKGETVQKLKLLVSNEIYDRSRPPRGAHEKSAAGEFVKVLCGLGVKEVRFFDAESLISAIELPDARKKGLLRILRGGSLERVQHEVSILIENSSFENDDLKAMMTQNLLQAASYSPIYRDEILTLIAWTEATSATVCEGVVRNLKKYPTRKLAFNKCRWRARYNEIDVGLSQRVLMETSSSLRYVPTGEALPHEVGHIVSGSMACAADILKLDPTSMEVASRSFISRELPGAIPYNIELLKTLSDEDLSLLRKSFILQSVPDIPEDREEFIRWYKQFRTSSAMKGRTSFHNSVELFQILGVFTAFHLDSSKNISNVLYINLLSDAAYYIREGLPLRYSHALITNSNEEIVRLRCMEHLKLTHESCLNPNFYGALIKAYGFDPLEYEDQLLSYSALGSCWISPYTSLIPALKKMYEMNREDFWTRFLSLPPVSFDGEFSRHRKELRDAAIRIVNLLEFAFRIATSFRFSQ